MREREVREHRVAVRRVVDLGVELEAVAPQRRRGRSRRCDAPAGACRRPTRQRAPRAPSSRSRRSPRAARSPCRRDSSRRSLPAPRPEKIGLAPSTCSRAKPYSRRVCSTCAAVALGDLLVPEAEAEDRDRQIEDRRRVVGALAVRAQRRAAREDDARVGAELRRAALRDRRSRRARAGGGSWSRSGGRTGRRSR